ncbi:MAG: OB-fold nucleic acid binding domain-containing protein [Bacteroidales bacterium]|nr:OB-fold nucleic acid binding domain-containing protein [Bacteroidales bacterium]
MKKILIYFAAFAALVSCTDLKEEWQPVLTCGDIEPAPKTLYTESSLPGEVNFISITDLKKMYRSGGLEIEDNVWIKGQVTSSDKSGNIYRELYIQDETGGIDVKVGKSSLYSEYLLGQWVYVNCKGLQLGAYNGMPQLGAPPDETSTNEYETSYIDVQVLIDQHVFPGAYDEPLDPIAITPADIRTSINKGFTGELWGKLVKLDGLTYKNEIFALVYPNPNLPHKSGNPENRVFFSDKGTWGITTWAMSKNKMLEYLDTPYVTPNGAMVNPDGTPVCIWDEVEVGSGNTRYGAIARISPASVLKDGKTLDSFGDDAYLTYKEIMRKYASANYVSHYFDFGGIDVQVRTSGYAKFSDEELDGRLREGTGSATIVGILTIYNDSAQITLVDEPSISVKVKDVAGTN